MTDTFNFPSSVYTALLLLPLNMKSLKFTINWMIVRYLTSDSSEFPKNYFLISFENLKKGNSGSKLNLYKNIEKIKVVKYYYYKKKKND